MFDYARVYVYVSNREAGYERGQLTSRQPLHIYNTARTNTHIGIMAAVDKTRCI